MAKHSNIAWFIDGVQIIPKYNKDPSCALVHHENRKPIDSLIKHLISYRGEREPLPEPTSVQDRLDAGVPIERQILQLQGRLR